MPYSITKEFHFSASHVLEGLPEGHPCRRLHGHNYVVVVELASDVLDPTGFVRDYGDLREFGRYLDERYDHRHLNDILPALNPTAENLAYRFFNWCAVRWPETAAVRVSETPTTWAEYRQTRGMAPQERRDFVAQARRVFAEDKEFAGAVGEALRHLSRKEGGAPSLAPESPTPIAFNPCDPLWRRAVEETARDLDRALSGSVVAQGPGA